MFIGSWLPSTSQGIIGVANPINFAPHIRSPKLIVHGRYDEIVSFRTSGEPFFKLLTEPKRLILYDGGHVPPLDVLMSTTSAWMDETLGRVTR